MVCTLIIDEQFPWFIYLVIHSPPKETQHLVQELPQPQFRVSDPKRSKCY